MLEIPRTIKDLSEDEFAGNVTAMERVQAKKSANIVEGYKFLPNEEQSELPFRFYAEININNSRLWDLFGSLCSELPETAALLFGFYDNDVNYGRYTDKNEIVLELIKYKREILEDCHLELGLIYNTESELIEVFIAEAKYIKFWGVSEDSFRDIMKNFNLYEVDNIEFIDEYPKVVYPLKTLIEDVVDTFEIIADFKETFLE
jgi:hypothetical protein